MNDHEWERRMITLLACVTFLSDILIEELNTKNYDILADSIDP